jgi:hypothetical protein
MAGERTFVVKFVSDVLGATKGIKKVGDDLGGMGSKLTSVLPSFKALAIAGTAAFAAVSASSVKLVNMASNLEESQSKVNTVFGASSDVITKFAETSARSFGITKQAALEATGTFGNLIQAFGIGQGKAADMSTTLIGLAADLASFNNTSIEDAIQALRSGLSGETEPLKKYGVAMNDVRLKQEAMTLGLYDGKGALDITAKTQAAYALILKDTSLAQGDFARTSDGFANQMRILKASLSDAATELGVILLPYFKRFVTFINDNIVPAVQEFARTIGKEGFVAALKIFVGELGITGAYIDRFAISFAISWNELLNDIFNGLRLVTLGFIQLVPGFTAAGKEIDSRLLNLGLSYQANSMYIQDFKDSSKQATKEMRINGAATDRLAQQARALGKSLGTSSDVPGGGSGVAKAVKTATEKLKDYTDALKSSNSAQKSFTAAQKASVKAGQSLTTANQSVTDAQAAFNAAVAGYGADSPQAKKAAFELAQAQRGLERAGYNVEGSLFAIADAEEALKKVRADPESTPQAIREAEISLAEAKLSSADAIDAQTEATDGLTKATGLLNDAIFGASVGSDIYTQLSDALTDAKQKQADATDAVAEAIDRETEALKNYADAIEAAGKIALLYPKVVANNPMAGVAGTIPATVTGNSTGFNAGSGGGFSPIINVNAGMISDPATLAYDLDELLNNFARQNGSSFYGLTR